MHPVPDFPRLLWRSFFPSADSAYPRFCWQRLVVMLLFWPLFLCLVLVNRLCLWLDTVLFPGFRHIVIREPVFVLGIPRSGTTFLHRLLAEDPRFTTMRLWELVFAPSILQRYFWHGIAQLDARLGAPLARTVRWLERHLLGRLDGVHETGLQAPEEDYLALAPWLGCFLLILPFGDPSLWSLARRDRDTSPALQQRLLAHYRGLVQRHLYVHGPEHQLLSKNPSFTPWIDALAEHFTDARFVACVRHPREAVPSQVNAMLIGARLFSARVRVHWWREGLTNMLAHYGDVLMQAQQSLPKTRLRVVDMRALTSSPQDVVAGLYHHFGWPLSAARRQRLTEHDRRARQYRSGHHYNSEALGIHQQDIERQFARFIDHFHLSASTTHRLQSN